MATTSHVEISTCFSTDLVPPTSFIPNSLNLYPKWPIKLDKDAWEEWQVQGLSADGSVALVIIFFRHRLNAPAGFRVGIIATWAGDGKGKKEDVWCSYVALPHSIITSEPDGRFAGEWRDEEEAGPPRVGFNVAADLSHAIFTFDVPDKVVGTVTLNASPSYDDTPAGEDESRFMPAFWWMRPIPMGGLNADLTFYPLQQGTPEGGFPRELHLQEDEGAFGAMERGWTSQAHKEIISHNWWVWGRVGPYLIHVIWVQGREEQPLLWASARLYHDGVVVAAPQKATTLNSGKVDDDTLVLEYIHDNDQEGVRGKFDLQHVGQKVIFRSKGRSWDFTARHVRPWYNIPTSKPGPGASGFSGFVLAIKGGLVGSGEIFEGTGIAGGGTIA